MMKRKKINLIILQKMKLRTLLKKDQMTNCSSKGNFGMQKVHEHDNSDGFTLLSSVNHLNYQIKNSISYEKHFSITEKVKVLF